MFLYGKLVIKWGNTKAVVYDAKVGEVPILFVSLKGLKSLQLYSLVAVIHNIIVIILLAGSFS